jgi:hypothetical protein
MDLAVCIFLFPFLFFLLLVRHLLQPVFSIISLANFDRARILGP